jgi:hypothetical protein
MADPVRYPARYEMVTDPQAMTISVGPRVFTKPDLSRRWEVDFHFKGKICEVPMGTGHDPKSLHKFFAEMLGPRFNFRFFAANYWLWVGNRMTTRTGNMLRFEGRHWRHYDSRLVATANKVLPYINEAERDGLYHLIPIILAHSASPQQIRTQIGRGAWRRVANNTVSRNRLIMHASLRCQEDERLATFLRLLDMPSGVMRAVSGRVGENEIIAARITPLKRPEEFQQTLNIVSDTRRMMMPDEFNPEWGLARMKREHELATKAIMQMRYSDKAFAADWSLEDDGFTAALLTSQASVATEGAIQHHCVASYARDCALGEYAVFRIEGRERATLGVMKGLVHQVYGACNAGVSDECKAFAHKIAVVYTAQLANTRRAA